MPISCHFRDCKALLVTSLTYVSGAIASVQTFTFDLETGVPVASKVGNLPSKFGHARLLGYRIICYDMYATDGQTDGRID